jgi:HK97 family phage prohead protease
MADWDTAYVNNLPDSAFLLVLPGGTKDSDGKTVPRTLRFFPVRNASGDVDLPHVRNALARIPQASSLSAAQRQTAMDKAKALAKTTSVSGDKGEYTGTAGSGRADEQVPARMVERTFQMADAAIRADGAGRTVQAYITPFHRPTEIKDQDGHYLETIQGDAFTKTLAERGLNFAVLYNHGRTFDGRTDGYLQMPIGVPRLVEPHERGLYSETEFLDNPLADAALDAIRKGALRGYSFTGRFVKSQRTPRGERAGLPTITRSEIVMREYGPVLYPAYEKAEIVGTRMVDVLAQLDPDDLDKLRELLGVPATPFVGAGSARSDPAEGQSTWTRSIRRARIARGME